MTDVSRYWYDPITGEILRRTLAKGEKKYDLPYFDRAEKGWNWSKYCVDIATGNVVECEDNHGGAIDPRATQIPNTVDPNTVKEI